jgi:hypothetical protein
MAEYADVLQRELERLSPPRIPLERLARRRDRKSRNRRIRAGVLGIVIALGTAYAASRLIHSTSTPMTPPGPTEGPRRNGEIIRFEDIAGSPAVDLVAQDPGTGQLRVFADTSSVIDCSFVRGEDCHMGIGRAAWSADGGWVAFEAWRSKPFCGGGDSGEGSCTSSLPEEGLWIVGAGGEPRHVARRPCHGSSCRNADSELVWAWGPAGAEIAYASRQPGEGELSVFDTSDGTRRSLGRVDGQITALSWAPDGRRIALAASGVLYLVDVESGERSRIATYRGVAEEMFSTGWPAGIEWSPDGTKIALVTHAGGPTWAWGVQVLDAAGSDLFVLPVAGGGQLIGDPPQVAWSPDGSRIAYTAALRDRTKPGSSGGYGAQIWTVAFDGSNPTMIFDRDWGLAVSLRPTWSPDGSRLAFQVWRADGRPIRWLVVDMGNLGEPHPIDGLTFASWGGGSFSSEAWAPGHLA